MFADCALRINGQRIKCVAAECRVFALCCTNERFSPSRLDAGFVRGLTYAKLESRKLSNATGILFSRRFLRA
jgi:hypothetical protein